MARIWRGLAVVGLLVVGVLTAPPAVAYGIAVSDSTANRSRTYLAYQNDSGPIFSIAFRTTREGEKRRLRAKLEVNMPSSASDYILVSRHAIRCAPSGSEDFQQVYGVQNIVRGESMVMTPRWTFTAGAPGVYHCWLWVNAGRPLPSSTRVTSNVFKVGLGSYLHATVPIRTTSGQSFEHDAPSNLITTGRASDQSALKWTAPAGITSFSASGDTYVTACTVVGGSTDPVTGKRLCDGHTDSSGSTINTKLVAMQYKTDGTGYCALTYLPSTSGMRTFISRYRHHRVLYHSGSVPVKTSSGCSRTFRIKIYVRSISGAAVMVHRQGTLTAALPPG